ncbi:MAG: ABC transporter ATP-binding protein [Deltaproteobacteria bacterium]|nr:ABC transporter ATP-binding protein [Deltaproteobacteria bacterium]
MEPLIEAREVNKSYGSQGKRVDVLKGLNLSINRGEKLAIVGASGAGKSTLLHILGTLDRPVSGEVLYGGMNPFTLNDAALAGFRNKRIGFVFQFHHLLPEFSAVENVMMPAVIAGISPADATREAIEILKEVGLENRLTHKPGELSGGEQQRVAVARALVLKPDALLADEPTGNLDAVTGESVHNLLMEINANKGVTMIIVTHNEKLAGRMERVVALIDGKAVERK